MARTRIGIDTGGTFTDVVLFDGKQLISHKLPSTPDDFSRAVVDGADAALDQAGEVAHWELVHATTVATNALLEGKGAPAALITSSGCRDVLEIGRQHRPSLYDLRAQRPAPWIPREARFELPARVAPDGTILMSPGEAEIDVVLDAIETLGIRSVAVCFLFSFLDPRHEQHVGEKARARGMAVSLSHEILPEFREFERTCATVANAGVSPVMQGYLQRLEQNLATDKLTIFQSNGGVTTAAHAGHHAVTTLLSGPAAGVVGAMATYTAASPDQQPNLITFDMGGTSTDVSLLDGDVTISSELHLGGWPVAIPMMDIHTVGAGGGSIAWIDAGGALLVGPQSAGASPGPACYGKGTLPTVTDANLLLGRLHPDRFLEGRMTLHREAARRAIQPLADQLDQTPEATAHDILTLVNANMERAIRVISVERGHDPRDFKLVSFGGAGGLHACALAQALDMPKVFLPAHPGVLCALGAVSADRVQFNSQTVMQPLDEAHFQALQTTMQRLLDEADNNLTAEDVAATDRACTPLLAARYRGQSFEIVIPFTNDLTATRQQFHTHHEKRFGYAMPDREIEAVTLRVRAVGRNETPAFPEIPPGQGGAQAQIEPGAYDRAKLGAGDIIIGPALLHEAYSTTWVPEGARLVVDSFGNAVIHLTATERGTTCP